MDWNSKEIAQAQVRLQLFDDARKTIALIIDPNAKRSAQSYLPK